MPKISIYNEIRLSIKILHVVTRYGTLELHYQLGYSMIKSMIIDRGYNEQLPTIWKSKREITNAKISTSPPVAHRVASQSVGHTMA